MDDDGSSSYSGSSNGTPGRRIDPHIADTPARTSSWVTASPSAAFDEQALKNKSWQSERGQGRHRVESSWEDVSSEEEEEGRVEEGEKAAQNGRDADGWEDESSSEDDSDSATSNATASGNAAKQRSDNRSALQEYKQSKRALMMSESNNMERYNRLMRGEQPPLTPPEESDRELNRTDTTEMLDEMEPYSAGKGTESVDEAEPIGRAHDLVLEEEKLKTPSRKESQQQLKSVEEQSVAPSKSKGKREKGPAATSEMLSSQLDQIADAAPPFSLWDYLKEEVMATDFDSTQEVKWERVTNFIAIPFWMEKIMIFGFAVCLDSFLYTFTILPLRALVAFYMWIRNTVLWLTGGQKKYLHSSHKCDMLKVLLIILSCYILSRITDASKMYHSVRGQDVVKLYVIFNVLEIADRLCCSFGQDLLDSLFSRLTLARCKDGRQPYLRPLGFFVLSLGYVLAHTLVLFYQLVTLNVAINSYDNALLTLLLSNQFVEIKGSVFKKFEKENLFQLTCADIVERFQLTLMLSAIGLRNLIEVAGSAAAKQSPPVPSSTPSPESLLNSSQDSSESGSFSLKPSALSALGILGPLPTSFTVFPSFSLLETTFTPVLIVLASECLVDWLKHAFITKFNHIRPSVYGRFMDVLCRDLTAAGGTITSRKRHTFVDQSPVVSRRLGFAALPLTCLLVRITSQIMGMLKDDSHFDECAMPDVHSHHHHHQSSNSQSGQSVLVMGWNLIRSFLVFVLGSVSNGAEAKVDLALNYIVSGSAWILTIFIAWIFLIAVKLLLGTNLVSYASHRYSTMGQREREEELNARDRPPIGVDKDEKAYEARVSQLIDKREDDSSRIGLNGQPIQVTPYKKEKKSGNAISLMDVDRYSMIRSRIW